MSNREHAGPAAAPQQGPTPPMMTLHAFGIAVGRLDEHTAQIVLHNPVMHAAAPLTREALRALGEQFLALADELTDAPARLDLPADAGRLIVPGGAR